MQKENKKSMSCRKFVIRHLPIFVSDGVINKRKEIRRSRIKSGMTPNLMGFTLIELLVVVLIIGILAAVAVPQYKLAVWKSRFATYRALADSLVSSARAYHTANGSWPSQLDELDVELPSGMTMVSAFYGHCGYNEKMYCCLTPPSPGWTTGGIVCGSKPYELSYSYVWANADGTEAQRRACISKEEKICKSFGGHKDTGSSYLMTPDDFKNGFILYTLP